MAHFVDSFPVSAKLKERLKRCGFTCLDDFVGLNVQDVVKEVDGIKKEDAAWLLAHVKRIRDPTSFSPQPVSAWSLLLSSSSSPSHISTFSKALDALLDGGVPLGSVTEICGAPGIGKTQLCVQLAVNALIPQVFEGVGGKISSTDEESPKTNNGGDANGDDRKLGEEIVERRPAVNAQDTSYVYVFDTEGSFVPRRIFDIAEATVDHFKRLANGLHADEDGEAIEQASVMSAEGFCDRILISRCLSLEELLAGVKHLHSIVQQRRVSLVIIDSLAMHFRQEIEDLTFRTRILNGLIQDLMKIAVGSSDRLGTAVVLTNQMTTKIYSDRHRSSHLVPALGESWGHAPTHRLLLHSGHDGKMDRLATIFKSPSRPERTAPFRVTSGGIRDVADAEEMSDSKPAAKAYDWSTKTAKLVDQSASDSKADVVRNEHVRKKQRLC